MDDLRDFNVCLIPWQKDDPVSTIPLVKHSQIWLERVKKILSCKEIERVSLKEGTKREARGETSDDMFFIALVISDIPSQRESR